MLRIVRRGDRHDPKDLTVSCRFEGDFVAAFRDGHADGLPPGETLKNLVHGAAREHGGGEIEPFAIAICDRVLARHRRITRARVEIAEQPWMRLEAAGKVQGQAFTGGTPERRTTAVTSNGTQVAVVSGIDDLPLMRTSGFGPSTPHQVDDSGASDRLQRLLVATLSVRWTYTTPDVTFAPYRQGIRAAIVETFAWHARQSVQHTLYSIADVILASFQEIADISLSLQERPYRLADPVGDRPDASDDLFVAVDEPLGIVEISVERDRS
jgi:urate oxidase